MEKRRFLKARQPLTQPRPASAGLSRPHSCTCGDRGREARLQPRRLVRAEPATWCCPFKKGEEGNSAPESR